MHARRGGPSIRPAHGWPMDESRSPDPDLFIRSFHATRSGLVGPLQDHAGTAAGGEFEMEGFGWAGLAFFDAQGFAVFLIVAVLTVLDDGGLIVAGREEIEFYVEFAGIFAGGGTDEPDTLRGLAGHDDVLADDT